MQPLSVQDQEIEALKEKHEEDKEPVKVAGDGKYDSPGEWKVDLVHWKTIYVVVFSFDIYIKW